MYGKENANHDLIIQYELTILRASDMDLRFQTGARILIRMPEPFGTGLFKINKQKIPLGGFDIIIDFINLELNNVKFFV